MRDEVEAVDSKEINNEKCPGFKRLQTGLLVIGSALLGGIAVSLWNRRSLADIQKQAQEKNPEPLPIDDDAIY